MASWKKVIVSGSSAELSGVSVSSNQVITNTQAGTRLTGSFTGSFTGDGSGLTGVSANFPGTAYSDLLQADKFFVQDSANGTSKYVTYANLLTDLAGTNLNTDNDSLNLNTVVAGLTSVTATDFNGNLTGNVTGNVTGVGAGVNFTGTASWAEFVVNGTGGNLTVSGSTNGTVINLDTETLALNGTTNQITTTATNNTITFSLPNSVIIPQNLTVSNNLTVNGTTTTVNTQNLVVGDRYALLASSSAPGNFDGGIIVANSVAGSPATQSGYALYMDASDGTATARWAVSSSVSQFATNITAAEYVVTAKLGSGTPSTDPTYGGSSVGGGNMFISNTGEIWIYA